MDCTGRIIMECILETKAVTFEEGTCAAWLYDLLKTHVGKLLVCNPRKNALLPGGNGKRQESLRLQAGNQLYGLDGLLLGAQGS
jgi:hypothetical protein